MSRIRRVELLRGAAIARLVSDRAVTLREEEGGFLLNDRVGLWLKTTARALPAQFSFSQSETREMMRLVRATDQFYIGLVCPSDGVCCVSWRDFEKLVAVGDVASKTLMVRREPGGSYRVKGTDRSKPLVVPKNRWGPHLADL